MTFLNSFKISTRVYLLAAVELVLLIAIGGTALIQMQKIGYALIDIAEEDIPITNLITQITEHQLQQAVLFERSLATGLAIASDLPVEKTVVELKTDFEKLSHKVDKEFKEAEAMVRTAIVETHSEEARAEFKQLIVKLEEIDKQHAQYDVTAADSFDMIINGQIDLAFVRSLDITELEDKIDHALIETLTHIQEFTAQAALKAEHDEVAAQKLILTIFVIALVISIALPFVISRAITIPVNRMRSRIKELTDGDGDLTARLEDSAGDETAAAAKNFNQLLEKLADMVRTISSTSEQLYEKSEHTIREMDSTLDNVGRQQQETEMVAAAVEEMSASITEVSKSTEEAMRLGLLVKEQVHASRTAAVESQSIMQNLSSDVSEASGAITSLAEETNRITEVLDAIRGIAEQTNLLALNAAIEAARAGESGRGFAVVADEVRTLAQRTQTSTQDIQELLERLQQQAQVAVSTMARGQQNADSCLTKSNETANALGVGAKAVEEVADLNSQIASASEQQAAVAHEVNVNLARITEVAHETKDGAERTASSGHKMSAALNDLRMFVAQFKA